ncbi:MAG TPA: serine/threonine-protein kinase [Anaeromyxobacteraceae bacterium]|jgi:serine/threonine-protein kinase|nr:serine/threonine-protein kinase [Anaeromyxobacteraceae bacterium]
MAVRKVGSSRILREIGRGGMSVVYEAYQEGLDRRVAVKAFQPGRTPSKDLVERFRREGRAYAQMRHPALVSVHDLVEKDEGLYLITEFVDGADLQKVLSAGGALPVACVATIGARMADALECIHGHALVHRDVKPSNVMLSRNGEVRLMDLGIAKDPIASEITRTGAVVGTPAYVAPEMLDGEPATEHSDVWSAGVMLYELAAGRRPFQGDTFPELFTAVRKHRPRPVREVAPDVPLRLARAIERCLEKRPGRRWPSAGALARELDACAERLLGDARREEVLAALLCDRGLIDGVRDVAVRPAFVPLAGGARRAGAPTRLMWAVTTVLALAGAYLAWAARAK